MPHIIVQDLAGSEKCKRAKTQGATLREGSSINKALLCLGTVVSALQQQQSKAFCKQGSVHVPWRDSKLTMLLKICLAGRSNTCVVLCISPAPINASETVCTLQFGARCRCITLRQAQTLSYMGVVRKESSAILGTSIPVSSLVAHDAMIFLLASSVLLLGVQVVSICYCLS